MKVSLLFLMLAIYGAVAQDDVVSAEQEDQTQDESSQTEGDSEVSSLKDDINAYLDDVLDNTDAALEAKADAVEKINNLIGTWVENAADRAIEVSKTVGDQEKALIESITANAQKLAEKKNELNNRAAEIAGKLFGSGAADFLKDLNKKQLEAKKNFLGWSQKIGEAVIDKKTELTQNVASGIKNVSSKANQVANEKQQKLVELEKKVSSNVIGGLKGLNGRLG